MRPPPECNDLLEALRLRAIDRQRRGGSGRHLVRRQGQSLEFREYLPYTPGSDVRHIDWRASLRHGRPNDWLVKTFVAEEDLTLVISIDPRPSMYLPLGLPKIEIAAWLAWAIGRIGLQSGDRIIIHRLFGPAANSTREFRGSTAIDGLWPGISALLSNTPDPDLTPNLHGLDRLLPPSSAWLILSDFYFPANADSDRLAHTLLGVRDGARWVVPGDLDSWPYECAELGDGARRIDGPGLIEDGLECDIRNDTLSRIEADIANHKQRFRSKSRTTGESLHWLWPNDHNADPTRFFKDRLAADPLLQNLFLRRGQE